MGDAAAVDPPTAAVLAELRERTAGCRDIGCVCEQICAGRWSSAGAIALTWPLGPSGSTTEGLVPLGPRFVVEIGADGHPARCGPVQLAANRRRTPGSLREPIRPGGGLGGDRGFDPRFAPGRLGPSPPAACAPTAVVGCWDAPARTCLRDDGTWTARAEDGQAGGRWGVRDATLVLRESWRATDPTTCTPSEPPPVPVPLDPAGAPRGWSAAPADAPLTPLCPGSSAGAPAAIGP